MPFNYHFFNRISYLLQQRLNDSLIKFQEYEAIIESILHNLKEWEPHIAEQLDTSVVSIEDCKKQLDDIKVVVLHTNSFPGPIIYCAIHCFAEKVTHAKLQIEKTRLALAVQACEAAAACISRPNTPQDPLPYRVPENELNARTKLEDFLDQVRS